MHDKGSGTPWSDAGWIAERAIVLQVLRDDRDVRWSLVELEGEVYDIDPLVLSEALERLGRHGIVVSCDEEYVASRCAWHLDELGMVSR
jgi:DNA-binding HxlR family transcriptional regulator